MAINVTIKKEVKVKEAAKFMKVAKKAGLKIKLPCDGKGKCGKCKVKFIGGNAPEATKNELKTLKREEIDQGIRLACETVIESDSEVEIL
ncbi:MAG: 2Fe-2S iron-sulfur cluster-binding protein [Firmicutes bacterium]|jgi:ferredoxin|nr:2Fe-2S iron-sulfur cluster-binding protein [Bacillota bacterium]